MIGSDILADLPKWKAFDRIQQLARVLVLYRAGYGVVLCRAGYPAAGTVGPPWAEVSSSEIRAALGRGEEPRHLVSRAVLAYARAHKLYGLS